MNKKKTFILLGLGALMGLMTALLAGCSSGDYYGTGTSGYVSTGYGYGMRDPYFYDPWYRYGGGTVIVTPPPSRPPVRPTPLPAPAPSPRPMPAPIPRGR